MSKLLSVLIVLCAPWTAIAQIQITSPSNGAMFVPGQQIPVTVTVASGTLISGLIIFGHNMGSSPILTSPPYTFSFVAPSASLGGALNLIAAGLSGDNPLTSNAVVIEVVPTGGATSLSLNPTSLFFDYVGERSPLGVTAHYANGTSIDVRNTQLATYSFGSAGIVQVETNGEVTAIGPGTTTITVSYGGQTASISASVPNNTRGDLNGNGKVDSDDLNILSSFLNTSATAPNDARDLNHDGVINALDARILTTICTYPRCATHQ